MTGTFVIGFALSLLTSLILTRLVRNTAVNRGWQSVGNEGRHLHRVPVPRLGGIAVYLSQLFSFAVVFSAFYLRRGERPSMHTLLLLVPVTLILGLGLLDDIFDLDAKTKIIVQIVAAAMVYGLGFRIGQVALLKSGDFGALSSFLLTIGWMLLITNAFNLIDGLDGLAAGSALFSTSVLFVLAMTAHTGVIGLVAICLCGAILGFLYYNFNPATIFLGDCGSLFIGFTLGILSLASNQKAPTMVAVGIPVVCFGLPLLDVAMSILRRFLSGRALFKADGEHIHHRLLRIGFSHRAAVLLLYGVSAFFGLFSLALLHRNGAIVAFVFVVIGCSVILFVGHLGYHEVDELRRLAFRTVQQRDVITHNLRFRRAGEALREVKTAAEIKAVLEDAFSGSPFDSFCLDFLGPVRDRVEHGKPRGSYNVAQHQLSFSWTRRSRERVDDACWKLELSLLDSSGNSCGTLLITRSSISKSLPIDINVLCGEFLSSLVGALSRCDHVRGSGTQRPVSITTGGPLAAASGD